MGEIGSGVMSADPSKVARIFEYLLAVKNLKEKVIRSVNEYEKLWWEKDFPKIEGMYIGGTGTNEEAWYEVHKQDISPVPKLPSELKKWVQNYDNPDRKPELHITLVTSNKDEEGNDIVESFEGDSDRVDAYQKWLTRWESWAEETAPKNKVQKIYMELFTLFQRFQREGEDLELGCGHGLLQWDIEGHQVSRHVLVTKLELIFDPKKGIFYLIPTSKGTVMETDMLLNVDFPNATRLIQMENQVKEFDFSPLEIKHIKQFLQEIVHTISPDGMYGEDKKEIIRGLNSPTISYSPGLFLRNIGGRLWQQELTKVIEKVKEGFPVPKTIEVLTTTAIQDSSDTTHQDNANDAWNSVGEELLFPLPTNKEQQLIAQKLASNTGVVIQGPPGTGKSHTIANLISHLLAHGKRVLVTSEKERALKVLKEKIPKEIRSLCVSVLGGDSKSVKEIEDSIRIIAENLDTKQPEILDKNINRLKLELKTVKRNIAKFNTLINEAAARENETETFSGLNLNPLEGTKWLQNNTTHSWIPDQVKPATEFLLSHKQLSRFFELLGTLSKEDIHSLELTRPKKEILPNPDIFSQRVDEFLRMESERNRTKVYIEGWAPKTINTINFDEWFNKTKAALNKLEELQSQTWLATIIDDCIKSQEQSNYWKQLVEEVRASLNEIQALEKELIEHTFHLPSSRGMPQLKEDLSILKERLAVKPKISWVYKNLSGRKLKYLFEEIKVNDAPIRGLEEVELLIKNIELTTLKQKLTTKWNRVLAEIDGPVIEVDQRRFVVYLKEMCSSIEVASTWVLSSDKEFSELIDAIGMQGVSRYADSQWFNELVNGLLALKVLEDWKEAKEFFEKVESLLTNGKNESSSHLIWNVFYNSLNDLDKVNWKNGYIEVSRLEDLEEDYRNFVELKEALLKVVPKWTTELIEKGGQGTPLLPPAELKEAWLWKQVDFWLKDMQSKPKVEQLEEQRKLEQLKEQKVIKELVAESTWKEQILRTTNSQKRSLFAWLKAIKRIGKGIGKYTNVYRKDASNEMMNAKGAIPVWIMPIQKVIENFELAEDMFDVIIIDESSQSNLFALSTLMRAKKAIIVGDENQISPESVGTEISEVHDLIERYLFDIPNSMQFDIRTSLYDTANRVFDSKIVLKEHYRCVPEIIQFSNDLMYGGMIDPLRLPLAKDMFDPPVKAVRVIDGYRIEGTSKAINEPEAEAIVDYISKCVEDLKYKDKTFGVISLQGPDQARIIENLLREKIGEEEMINRKLITGDAYAFQGDERDIIFLSMVIAPNVRYVALTKTSDNQRFNVAASRARDQMILFHSVDANDLSPNDVRFRLLQHCKNPYRVQEELENHKDEFDSNFEKDVYSLISSRGYRVKPQVKVGTLGKRIDLVIEGLRTRLAVECDGDRWHGLDKWEEDMERQRVLERVGWTFWRVRGSAFYANPAKAMELLWTKLDEMGIEPNVITAEDKSDENLSRPIGTQEIVLKPSPTRKIETKSNSEKRVSPNIEQNDLFTLELEGLHKHENLFDLLEEDQKGS